MDNLYILNYILLGYFLIGTILMWFINKKRNIVDANKNWLKLIVYFFILFLLFTIIFIKPELFIYCTALISLLAIIEMCILFANKNISKQNILIALIVLIILSYGLILFSRLQNQIIYYCLFIIVSFDAYSQLFGQLLGKHKLISKVSPNKTVEGFLGGLTAAIITSLIAGIILDFSILFALSSGLIIAFSALIGDLAASWIKRKALIKDYSNTIPGHGGLLDRFDSLFTAATFMYLYTLIL